METLRVAISGEFPKEEPKRGNCSEHPMNKVGACGMWTGHEHGWTPPTNVDLLKQQITDQAYNLTVDKANIALEVLDWVVSHQAVGERIATLNKTQQRYVQRYDKTGMLYLPSYLDRIKDVRA